MMTQEIKEIYETWFLITTGFLPEQAMDALEEKDKHYAVAIGQLSKRNQELEDQLKEVQGKLNTALGHLDQQQALYSDLHKQLAITGKNCNQVPKGRGFCDNCSDEKPWLCRYTNTPAALMKVEELEKELEAVRKRSVCLYNQGYMAGHDDTVEGCFTDIYPEDINEYHDDVVADLLKESSDD